MVTYEITFPGHLYIQGENVKLDQNTFLLLVEKPQKHKASGGINTVDSFHINLQLELHSPVLS